MTYNEKRKCWGCGKPLNHPHLENCKRRNTNIENDRVRLVDVSTREKEGMGTEGRWYNV